MKTTKNLTAWLAMSMFLLGMGGMAGGSAVDSNSIVQDGIEYYIQTDKAVYNLGENVEMLYRVTNLGVEITIFDFPLAESEQSLFTVEEEGVRIWGRRFDFSRVTSGFVLNPGEFKEYTGIWNMTADNGTLNPDDDTLINPGIYNIIGRLNLTGGTYIGDENTRVSVLVTIIPEPAMIYYVDADATGVNDGSSWTDAYKYLQDALSAAWSGDEIWVADGTYKPDQGSGQTPGDREATFQLKNGVALYGGFAGGETSLDERDCETNETILSGDLDGNDVDVNEPADLLGEPTRAENSYHVVMSGNGLDESAVLDGFVITGGNANGPGFLHLHSRGGGMRNNGGSPTLTNCTFSGNAARIFGGGMYEDGNTILINCFFTGNTAQEGGGMANKRGNPMVINCTFSGNSAPSSGQLWGAGGGMCNCGGDPTLVNCIFSGNSGGGLNTSCSKPTVTNCTFSGNSGGGISGDDDTYLTLTNSILWGNGGTDESAQISVYRPQTVVNYSCIQGWTGALGGTGNISDDPLFVDANGADNVVGTKDDNLRLLHGSPCIDVGDNLALPPSLLTDLDGNPRILNGTVDLGPYEGAKQGFLLSAESVTVPEGQTATFTVALAMDPQESVEVSVAHHSGDPDITVESGVTLTFDSFNYSDPQTVTLAAGKDGDYLNGTALITISAAGIFTAGVTATEWDSDTPTVLYVDSKAPGANDGTSWADGFTDLQDALSIAATQHPDVEEIRVAQGIYRPAEPSGNRDARFQLIKGVTIKGGYAGYSEPDPDARDVDAYETILSGDLNGDDTPNFANNGDNSYHVVTGSGTDATAILDGFTITGGNANAPWRHRGAGMHNSGGSPTLNKCTFTGNTSSRSGGGMCNQSNSSPTLFNCTFSGNSAGGHGGGMVNYDRSSPRLTNCTFAGNSAIYGGGIFFNFDSSSTVSNCTFSGNSAAVGGGVYNWQGSNTTLTNCILWDDTPGEISGSAVVTYSDVQDGWAGKGNIDADTCFVEPGYWDANNVWVDGDYHLLVGSPCIDAGDPNYVAEPNETDLDGKPRIIDGRIDMGAYEYFPPIPAEVRIVPRTLNLSSEGKWITCYIWLPEDYDVADIDPNSVFLEDEIEAESFWVDEQEQVAIAKFSRSEVQWMLEPGDVELAVSGELSDGTRFEGADTIRIIDKGRKNIEY